MRFLKYVKIGDVIVISVILLITAGVFGFRLFQSGEGGVVYVNMDGQIREFPLSRDMTVNLYGGDHSLKLIIKDGKAFVGEADCPDKLCVGMGEISKNGEFIACVPAKIYIKIIGSHEVEYDRVVG